MITDKYHVLNPGQNFGVLDLAPGSGEDPVKKRYGSETFHTRQVSEIRISGHGQSYAFCARSADRKLFEILDTLILRTTDWKD